MSRYEYQILKDVRYVLSFKTLNKKVGCVFVFTASESLAIVDPEPPMSGLSLVAVSGAAATPDAGSRGSLPDRRTMYNSRSRKVDSVKDETIRASLSGNSRSSSSTRLQEI